MRRLSWLILLALLTGGCLGPNDEYPLSYSIDLPDELPDGTAIISKNDSDRINASATDFDATGTRFKISSAIFTIVTADDLSPDDSVEFCFEDPIWVEPPGGERIEVAQAGLCITSGGSNRLPEQ